jgi:muconolactone D-isomerase
VQRKGKWCHLQQVAGSYSNVSILDVEDTAELQELISKLLLFLYINISVKPFCRTLAAIHKDDS